jgi:LysM repeat protein
MAKRKRQYVTYTDAELGDKLEAVAAADDVSIAQLLREGLRRELQARENNE